MNKYYWDTLYCFCYTTFNRMDCNRVKFDSGTMSYRFYHNDELIGIAPIEAIELFTKDL